MVISEGMFLWIENILNFEYLDRIEKTVSITTHTAELEEKGVRLKLTAVDTPGFGDSINGQDRFLIFLIFLGQNCKLNLK